MGFGVSKFGGKAKYLERLTSRLRLKSVEFDKEIDGSSPPGIFVGRKNYPKVYIGPLISEQEDSFIYDTPELWIKHGEVEKVQDFRLNLVRGKYLSDVREQNKITESLRDIVLAKKSPGVHAEFEKRPRGFLMDEESTLIGPSAEIKEIDVENRKYDSVLEKFYYDGDLKAKDAILKLYEKGYFVSKIQKTLSAGVLGIEKNRKLVPTRWSITAVDSTISEHLLQEVKCMPVLDRFRVYEFESFRNRFLVLMFPSLWQYNSIEAFIKVLGNEIAMFGDFERFEPKKGYSPMGGCYYSARLAIAEKMFKEGFQAGAIVFRESYPGYVPLGVWNVRENMRKAVNSHFREFSNMKEALKYISGRLELPMHKYLRKSEILKNLNFQTTLRKFAKR